ncbi:hypothetical protein [Bosea sp. BK604]|uniref:hypothetical protein n=1 Tax=Bosea sp. BK604 TaxID=2512180 RepID=UPI00104D08B3|nr:hypothetical protein [Bosea sp. BK604]TCR63043.1 hypothetical protein EV560_109137 [Bosea sp. BK604]
MFWNKKKVTDEDVFRLVARSFYPFHDPTIAGLLKIAAHFDGGDRVKRAVISIRGFHSVSCLYSALCVMECAEAGLRTPDLDARIEAIVRAGLKDFMKPARSIYDDVATLFGKRVNEINGLLEICGGKSRAEGEGLLIMFTFDRVFGREEFMANPDATLPLAEAFTKAILELRIAFRNGLKR